MWRKDFGDSEGEQGGGDGCGEKTLDFLVPVEGEAEGICRWTEVGGGPREREGSRVTGTIGVFSLEPLVGTGAVDQAGRRAWVVWVWRGGWELGSRRPQAPRPSCPVFRGVQAGDVNVLGGLGEAALLCVPDFPLHDRLCEPPVHHLPGDPSLPVARALRQPLMSLG